MRRIPINQDEVVRLYRDEGLRAQAIADRLGTTTALVYERLGRAGIVRSRKALLSIDEMTRLYRDEAWPLLRVAEHLGVASDTVRRHLQDAGVAIRSRTKGDEPRTRRPCPSSVTFRAYVLGLVWGDFFVEPRKPQGSTIGVKTSTTASEQVTLAKSVFSAFGPVRYGGRTLRASLDLSFEFLASKYAGIVPTWIRGPDPEAAFAAGYVDAEGSFGVYESRGRFKLESYDQPVTGWFDEWCTRIGVRSRHIKTGHAGELRQDGSVFAADLWRVNVNERQSLLRLIASLDPFARHERRRATMNAVRENILERCWSRDPDRTLSQCFDHQPR